MKLDEDKELVHSIKVSDIEIDSLLTAVNKAIKEGATDIHIREDRSQSEQKHLGY